MRNKPTCSFVAASSPFWMACSRGAAQWSQCIPLETFASQNDYIVLDIFLWKVRMRNVDGRWKFSEGGEGCQAQRLVASSPLREGMPGFQRG